MIKDFKYQEASIAVLEMRWDKNIADNVGDDRWIAWKAMAIENHQQQKCTTFVILDGVDPIGEGTLVFSSQNVEINGLRIDKQYEDQGHISNLVKVMEQHAKSLGYKTAIIGVEPSETRNIKIYFHWGYDTFVKSETEEDGLILFYAKKL